MMERKSHWENIYQSKDQKEMSWFQETPETSLSLIRQFNILKTAKIIDIGGGDSLFVDHLLELDFQDITVLDISETALERAKKRLGKKANKVKWIVTDAANFHPTEQYDLWHDRATFHFLTSEEEIASYITTAQDSIKPNGILIIGTFSEQGPKSCSGIAIKQYSESTMTERFKKFFSKVKCFPIDHTTSFGTIQNFIFCSFRRLKSI
jgi:ubiquinone/menaquinone biosynthesis C-methylase UbiE